MAKVGRPKKVVETEPEFEKIRKELAAMDEAEPETREQFIERVSVGIVSNIRDYETLKHGRTMATAAFGLATELANLLGKRGEKD